MPAILFPTVITDAVQMTVCFVYTGSVVSFAVP